MGFAPTARAKKLSAAALVAATVAVLVVLAPGALAHPFHPGASEPDTTAPGLKLARIGAFDYPVFVASPRGDSTRQVIVEQDGQVRMRSGGDVLSRPFLDISDIVEFNGGERGLFSIAFAPDYAESRLFYVFYTQAGGDLRIDEFKRSSNPNVALKSSRRQVLKIEHSAYGNHNGGQLQFPPSGGSLYISTGDGGGGGDPDRNGQDRNSLLGKILRINPRGRSVAGAYSIPSGNPYIARSGRDEIWHYGLRNPWRFSFDRANGNMAIGDVGQGAFEEIDYVGSTRRGVNFGWNCFEGRSSYADCNPSNAVFPVLQYSHAGEGNASCSVTGGYVSRDPAVPAVSGRYLYGDYCTGALHAATLREGQDTPESQNRTLGLIVPRLTGFGEDTQGRIYATSREYDGRRGAVYRLQTP